jgi:hypothetical protein
MLQKKHENDWGIRTCNLMIVVDEVKAGWLGGLYGTEEKNPIKVPVLAALDVSDSDRLGELMNVGELRNESWDLPLARGVKSLESANISDQALHRTTRTSAAAADAVTIFTIPKDFNSSNAVSTKFCGRPVESARISMDCGGGGKLAGANANNARMWAIMHAAGIEIRREEEDGEVLTSAQPKAGMQMRGEPANMRGMIADCCGKAALMTQLGMFTGQVPNEGRTSGCMAASSRRSAWRDKMLLPGTTAVIKAHAAAAASLGRGLPEATAEATEWKREWVSRRALGGDGADNDADDAGAANNCCFNAEIIATSSFRKSLIVSTGGGTLPAMAS